MKLLSSVLLLAGIFSISHVYADRVIWDGQVSAKGEPSPIVHLKEGEKYKIRVKGEVNLGKWRQQGEALAEDACYEYNSKVAPKRLETFKNSMNIDVCQGLFHVDHIYESDYFLAVQSGIHFWVHDSNYDDNSGSFRVEVILKD